MPAEHDPSGAQAGCEKMGGAAAARRVARSAGEGDRREVRCLARIADGLSDIF